MRWPLCAGPIGVRNARRLLRPTCQVTCGFEVPQNPAKHALPGRLVPGQMKCEELVVIPCRHSIRSIAFGLGHARTTLPPHYRTIPTRRPAQTAAGFARRRAWPIPPAASAWTWWEYREYSTGQRGPFFRLGEVSRRSRHEAPAGRTYQARMHDRPRKRQGAFDRVDPLPRTISPRIMLSCGEGARSVRRS